MGKPEQWRKARLETGKEIKRLDSRAKKKQQKSNAGETITKAEEGVFNRRHALGPYITNIKALEASRVVTGKGNKNKKRTGFQTSRHPHKMTKGGKYGKLTIDGTQLVEKHRHLEKEAGMVFLDKKVDSDFIYLISKRYDKKTIIYQKLYSKH